MPGSTLSGGGHQRDVHYNAAGNGSDVATWTLTGLPAGGQYQVSTTWSPFVNRATNARYRILDGTTEVFSTTVNQKNAPLGDVNDAGTNFQHLGVVSINSGTLVIELSDDADAYVIADAVRVSAYAPVVDTDAPTAQMSNPTDGGTVTPDGLNTQGYLEVTFADIGDGVDPASINGDEITISGAGVGTVALAGTADLVSGTTYRYAFTGDFVDGAVSVELVAGSFQDLADVPNANAQAVWSFLVESPPPFQTTIIDNGDAEFSTSGSWVNSTGGGHQRDVHYSAGGDGSDVATWTLTGLAGGAVSGVGDLVAVREPGNRRALSDSRWDERGLFDHGQPDGRSCGRRERCWYEFPAFGCRHDQQRYAGDRVVRQRQRLCHRRRGEGIALLGPGGSDGTDVQSD